MEINEVGVFFGATIAVAAGLGATIVTAKIAIIALVVLALIGATVFNVSYRNFSRKLYLEQQELWKCFKQRYYQPTQVSAQCYYEIKQQFFKKI